MQYASRQVTLHAGSSYPWNYVITSGARDKARDPTKGDAMSKIALWVILLMVCAGLAAMYIYSDHFGNVEMQKTMSELFKFGIGALIGAWSNELAK